ncbi:hypothetical protein PTSG_03375 [Salpingoeca rosetta]|uniref:Uncharacterized protein n=1 Tax=Salpingoeca rosetta (strain ATCC 50818 / BSB-021) TaxID=946362 RepID=F2U508_SALR5|nr:uncharacterized protein PTSG_03375 [Salpingoeca rosetta]EGD82724.1 hypothetical protein PTSG_03375 [Salpingoeca rosetta]|eukprot:XP_004995960.1 hypothetical protein PTSG_03375 [Salpingoeca rosetta]
MSGSTLVVAAIRRQPAQCLFRIAHQRYCRSSSSRASPYSVARFGSSSQRLSQRFNGTCSIGTASSAIDAATSSKTRAATVTCGKRQVSFRQDVMAWQADGSVIAEDGGSAVLGTVMANPHDVQRGKRVNVTYHEPDASVNVIFKNFLRRQLSETEREVVTTSVLRHVLVPRLRGNHTLHQHRLCLR